MADETSIEGTRNGRVQKKAVKKGGWTKARRTIFLRSLTETCNVTLSVRRAGMRSVYDLRHRDPAFAQLWDEALAIGYDRLEALLLQRALEGVNDIDVTALVDQSIDQGVDADASVAEDGEAQPARGHRIPGSGIAREMGRGDIQLALALLNRRGTKGGLRAGNSRKLMSADEVDALLTRKLDALARRRGGTSDGKA